MSILHELQKRWPYRRGFVIVGLDPSGGDRQGAGWSTATILEGHTNSLSQSSLVRRSTFVTGVAISILLWTTSMTLKKLFQDYLQLLLTQ